MENIKEKFLNYLQNHNNLTLATSTKDGKPAAATVAYVNDGNIVYFGTNKNSNKVQNITQNPNVAYTVDEDYENLEELQGTQVQGKASILNNPQEMQKVGEMMGKKFIQMADIPMSADTILIKIEPKKGHFLDYTKGFNHRDYLDFTT